MGSLPVPPPRAATGPVPTTTSLGPPAPPKPRAMSHALPAPSAPTPSLDFILDSGLFPSLPAANGTVSHHDLIGRRPVVSPAAPVRQALDVPSPAPAAPLHQLSPGQIAGPRPSVLRRASSFDDRHGNHAGVGAAGRSDQTPSRSSIDTVRPAHHELGRVQESVDPHARLHSHTSGRPRAPSIDSLARPPRTSSKPHSRSSSLGQAAGIRLGTDSDKAALKLLANLHHLSPPSRALPVPKTCVLQPMALLGPLALILEALVCERAVLRDEAAPALAPLRDGTVLQLADGELDWAAVRTYMRAVGKTVDALLPLLARARRDDVETLTKGVRAHVGKLKKVFGEVAAAYVDRYGCIRGWWDEDGMKGAAMEVGRWGDMFEA